MAATLLQQLEGLTIGMAYSKISQAECKEKSLMRLVLMFAYLAVLMRLKFAQLFGYKNMAVNDMYAFQSKCVDFIIYTLCGHIILVDITGLLIFLLLPKKPGL